MDESRRNSSSWMMRKSMQPITEELQDEQEVEEVEGEADRLEVRQNLLRVTTTKLGNEHPVY